MLPLSSPIVVPGRKQLPAKETAWISVRFGYSAGSTDGLGTHPVPELDSLSPFTRLLISTGQVFQFLARLHTTQE